MPEPIRVYLGDCCPCCDDTGGGGTHSVTITCCTGGPQVVNLPDTIYLTSQAGPFNAAPVSIPLTFVPANNWWSVSMLWTNDVGTVWTLGVTWDPNGCVIIFDAFTVVDGFTVACEVLGPFCGVNLLNFAPFSCSPLYIRYQRGDDTCSCTPMGPNDGIFTLSL